MRGKLTPGWNHKRELAIHRQRWKDAGIEYGKCLCGCGQTTAPARQTIATRPGTIRNEPQRFRPGHGGRLRGRDDVDYEVDPESGCWLWAD